MNPPIVLFVYNRPLHTAQTIAALLQNPNAHEFELFVFADGAKHEADLPQVTAVRALVGKVQGFKNIHLTTSEVNQGLARAVIAGVGKVLEMYPSAIVMEDDMICATNFLAFMRDALACYAQSPHIFSITGYTFPIKIPADYPHDIYLSPRPSSWGWATWRDRWQKADWQVTDFQAFIQDKNQRKAFNQGGEDMSIMLLRQQRGEINSWAIRWAYTHYRQGAYCVYPTHSKIHNIGADNSGVHTPATTKYDAHVHELPYTLPALPAPEASILHNFKQFFRRSLIRKTINYWKYGISS